MPMRVQLPGAKAGQGSQGSYRGEEKGAGDAGFRNSGFRFRGSRASLPLSVDLRKSETNCCDLILPIPTFFN